jgi:Zn-dependent protease
MTATMAATMEESDAAAPAPSKRSFPTSISLGSCIGGVPIKLHLSFFLLVLIEFVTSIRLAGEFPLYMLFVVVLYGPVLLLTVLIHEFGHIFATKRQGGEVGGIVLWVSKSYTHISYHVSFCKS